MADMTIKEIEDLATWAESITEDNPPAMRYQIGALDLLRFSSALRQLLNAQKWREIETAPKDGTPLLLWEDDQAFIGRYHDVARKPGWYSDGNDPEFDYPSPDKPTGWLPLPSPPQEKENGDG